MISMKDRERYFFRIEGKGCKKKYESDLSDEFIEFRRKSFLSKDGKWWKKNYESDESDLF